MYKNIDKMKAEGHKLLASKKTPLSAKTYLMLKDIADTEGVYKAIDTAMCIGFYVGYETRKAEERTGSDDSNA